MSSTVTHGFLASGVGPLKRGSTTRNPFKEERITGANNQQRKYIAATAKTRIRSVWSRRQLEEAFNADLRYPLRLDIFLEFS